MDEHDKGPAPYRKRHPRSADRERLSDLDLGSGTLRPGGGSHVTNWRDCSEPTSASTLIAAALGPLVGSLDEQRAVAKLLNASPWRDPIFIYSIDPSLGPGVDAIQVFEEMPDGSLRPRPASDPKTPNSKNTEPEQRVMGDFQGNDDVKGTAAEWSKPRDAEALVACVGPCAPPPTTSLVAALLVHIAAMEAENAALRIDKESLSAMFAAERDAWLRAALPMPGEDGAARPESNPFRDFSPGRRPVGG